MNRDEQVIAYSVFRTPYIRTCISDRDWIPRTPPRLRVVLPDLSCDSQLSSAAVVACSLTSERTVAIRLLRQPGPPLSRFLHLHLSPRSADGRVLRMYVRRDSGTGLDVSPSPGLVLQSAWDLGSCSGGPRARGRADEGVPR